MTNASSSCFCFQSCIRFRLAVLTAFLWWTYVDLKENMDKQRDLKVPILEVDISNERAFFYAAIVVSVLTVRTAFSHVSVTL